jgi:nucleotide sugar dehydrogenase
LKTAIGAIAHHARPGALVLVECTLPPGTCAQVIIPELEAGAVARGLPSGAFLPAYSYERVMPGLHYLDSIRRFWRVYAGHTEEAERACAAFLSTLIDVKTYPLTKLHSLTACETAKVLENSYRAVNIAFIDEWGRFAERVGVDLFQVIDAIRLRPTHANMRQPGLGVGGYCLTKDPLFAAVGARDLLGVGDMPFPFCSMALEVNRAMPLHAIRHLTALLGMLEGKRVLLLGATYIADVADTRYSASEILYHALNREGADVAVHDPMICQWQEVGLATERIFPQANDFDAVVFAVGHSDYRGIDMTDWLNGARPTIRDANRVLTPVQVEAVRASGCPFAMTGNGAV